MNKRGFTLVELLAVIIILSLLALITTTAITKIVKDSKEELSDTQIALIKSTAEMWGADNIDKLPSIVSCSYLTLKDLKDLGIIDSSVIDPKTNQQISDNLIIKISATLGSSNNKVLTYEVDSNDINNCEHIQI